MRTVGRRSFLMVVCVVLTLAFVLSSCQPTAVPVPEAETVSAGPLAQVTFVVTPPAGTDSSAKLTLEILDEVTGLALNPSRLSMTATSDGRFTVEAAFSEGSLVKYRYLREGTPPAVEYGSTNQQIRYRIFRVYGSDQVEDIIAAWNDQPFTGAVGRIRGQAIDNTNNTPLPNLYVTAAGISTLTSSDGSFLLEGIPVGTHQLVAISLDGAYKTFQQGATVAAGATTPAAIALSPVQMIAVNFVVKPPEGNLTGVTRGIALGEHLLEDSETIVLHQNTAARMSSHGLHAINEGIQVVAVIGHMLTGVVAVLLHEGCDLRLAGSVDSLDQGNAEIAVVDTPNLHATVRIARPRIVDALDQGAVFHFDVEPGPFLDHSFRAGIGNVVDLAQL